MTPPPSRAPPAPRACTAASPRAGQSTGSAGALVSAHQRLIDRPPEPSRSGHTPQLTPLSPLAAQAWRRETRVAPGEPTLAPSSASRLGAASPRSSPRSSPQSPLNHAIEVHTLRGGRVAALAAQPSAVARLSVLSSSWRCRSRSGMAPPLWRPEHAGSAGRAGQRGGARYSYTPVYTRATRFYTYLKGPALRRATGRGARGAARGRRAPGGARARAAGGIGGYGVCTRRLDALCLSHGISHDPFSLRATSRAGRVSRACLRCLP